MTKENHTPTQEIDKMLKEEFEKLVKKTVTSEEFDVWEKAYMTSDADKSEFCRRVAPLVRDVTPKHYGYIRSTLSNWRGEMEINISTGKAELSNVEEIFEPIPTYARVFDAMDYDLGVVVVKSYKTA